MTYAGRRVKQHCFIQALGSAQNKEKIPSQLEQKEPVQIIIYWDASAQPLWDNKAGTHLSID
jgi:hypothetical protein